MIPARAAAARNTSTAASRRNPHRWSLPPRSRGGGYAARSINSEWPRDSCDSSRRFTARPLSRRPGPSSPFGRTRSPRSIPRRRSCRYSCHGSSIDGRRIPMTRTSRTRSYKVEYRRRSISSTTEVGSIRSCTATSMPARGRGIDVLRGPCGRHPYRSAHRMHARSARQCVDCRIWGYGASFRGWPR